MPYGDPIQGHKAFCVRGGMSENSKTGAEKKEEHFSGAYLKQLRCMVKEQTLTAVQVQKILGVYDTAAKQTTAETADKIFSKPSSRFANLPPLPIHIRMRMIRERRRKTQADVQKILGYNHESSISRIECGKQAVTEKEILLLCKALEFDPIFFSNRNMYLSDADLIERRSAS